MADVRIRYLVDLLDRGTGRLLAQDRAIQKSMTATDRLNAKLTAGAQRAGAAQTTAASKAATSTSRLATASRGAAGGVEVLNRAQQHAIAVGTRVQHVAEAETRALRAQGAAARQAAAGHEARTAAARRSARAATSRAASGASGLKLSREERERIGGGVVGGVIGRAARTAGLGGGLGLGVAVAQTVKFDRAMRNVNSIAGLTEKQLAAVSNTVRDLGAQTAQAPRTLAEGLYDLVSSGFDARESMHILEKAANAATAGLTSTEVSTKAVAAVLNAYRLPASQAGTVSDQLFRTVDRGVISFEQLAENVGDVLPFAASLGVGLEQVGASIATMTKAGISAPETMTRIKAVMTTMLKPGEDLANAIKATGAESAEALIKQKGFQGALEALVATTDGSKSAIASLFPNVRALGGALALTGGNAKGAQKDLSGMRDASGATSRALAEQSKSVSFQWDKLKATASSLAIQVGSRLVPHLRTALDSLARFVGGMRDGTGSGGRFAAKMRDVWDALRPLVAVLRRISRFLIDHPQLLVAAGAAWATYKVAAIAEIAIVRGAALGLFGPAMRTRMADRAGTAGRRTGRSFGRAFGAAAVVGVALILPELVRMVDRALTNAVGGNTSGGRAAKRFNRSGAPPGSKARGPLDWLQDKVGGLFRREGGWTPRFQNGGLVPIMGSGGELLVDGPRAVAIPGSDRRDATPVWARPGSAVLTYSGQALMAAGASLPEAVAAQAPHFQRGGIVPGKYTATSYGPPWGGIQGTGVTRTGVNLKNAPKVYGIAVDPRMIALGSKVFAHPNPFGYTGRFSAFDTGGAIKGRRIDFYDWRGRRRQNQWGRRAVTVSRARIAPRQDGEDVYRAPGGGAAETTVRILPRNRRRAGLLDDAFTQGLQAGREGLTRGVVAAEGNPVMRAIREALRGAGTQPDRGGPARKAAAPTLSETGGFPAGSRIARMHAKASAINAKAYQYSWGGGHGRIGVPTVGTRTPRGGKRGLGYDCSGAVSAVLGAGGLLKSPLTSGGLMSWGKAGAGKRLAVHSDPGHVIMRIGRRYWGTSELNPQGGAGWIPRNTMRGRGVVRTWPGMRAGGIVGSAADRKRWPRFMALADRTWNRHAALTGFRGRPPRVTVADLPEGINAVTHNKRTIRISRKVVHRIFDPKYRARSYGLRTLVHEFAHVAQRRSLARPRENEGGATLFSERFARRIYGGLKPPYHKAGPPPYPKEIAWVRRNRSADWVRQGQFRRFQRGGIVGPALTRGVDRAATFAGGSLEALDTIIGRAVEAKLLALREQLLARVRRGGPANVVQRLQSMIDLVDFELGRRIGRIQDVVEQRTRSIDLGRGVMERGLRAEGIAPDSSRGLAVQQAGQAVETAVRSQNVRSLQSALRRATNAGDRTAVREITTRLQDAQAELQESFTRQIELAREAIRAQAQERVDAAQYSLDLHSANVALHEATLRVAGSAESAEGLRSRAHATLAAVPGLAALRDALAGQAQAALATGDLAGFRHATVAATQAAADIANAHADAADLVLQAAEKLRDAALKAAQDAVDATSFTRDISGLNLQGLELQQRLAGTQDSTVARQARADFIRAQVIPALRSELEALNAQVRVAREQEGETSEAYRQAVLAALGKNNELMQADLDATEQVVENTEPLKEYAGALAFESRGQQFTDLLNLGVGV